MAAEGLDQALGPSQVEEAEADLKQDTVTDRWAVPELDCPAADKAALSAGEELDRAAVEVVVIDLAALQVLGLAASVLAADRVVPVAVAVDHRHYPEDEEVEGKEHMVLCSEDHMASQPRQYLVWLTHMENSRSQAFAAE